jgi:hypothetical protein
MGWERLTQDEEGRQRAAQLDLTLGKRESTYRF